MQVKIDKLDYYGNGVANTNGKKCFVSKTLPGEVVDIKIFIDKKKYCFAKVIKLIEESSDRIKAKCPYFEQCGGCQYLNLNYAKSIEYKEKYLNEIMNDLIVLPIKIISNTNPFHYRNKISLKIKDGLIGYYEEKSHQIVAIKNCLLASKAINSIINDLYYLNIKNGDITIKSNFNGQLLIVIDSKEEININLLLKNNNIAGLVYNKNVVKNTPYFLDKIGDKFFQIGYDSFFQINNEITRIIYDDIKKLIGKPQKLLDLYCGGGSIGLYVSPDNCSVFGVDNNKDAIAMALTNAKINKNNNAKYVLNDAGKSTKFMVDKFDVIIIDPPRSGLDKTTCNYLLNSNAEKIIYLSCNPITLKNNLEDLNKKYEITYINGYDMFSYTYHVETLVLLSKK